MKSAVDSTIRHADSTELRKPSIMSANETVMLHCLS